jgi:hypothetical protein
VLQKKSKTEPLGLGFGCTIENSDGWQWVMVVGWCVCDSGGMVGLIAQAAVAGIEKRIQN